MTFIDILGYIGTVLTISAFLPQAIQTIKTRKTRDLSLPTYIILAVSALVWTSYGIGTHAIPIVLTNWVVLAVSSVILVIKLQEG